MSTTTSPTRNVLAQASEPDVVGLGSQKDAETTTSPHPWRRFFARIVDVTLVYFPIALALIYVASAYFGAHILDKTYNFFWTIAFVGFVQPFSESLFLTLF